MVDSRASVVRSRRSPPRAAEHGREPHVRRSGGPAMLRASLWLALLGIAASLHGSAQAPLQPPIDRKAWMVSSPSQRLKIVKSIGRSANYPNLADYMRV